LCRLITVDPIDHDALTAYLNRQTEADFATEATAQAQG